MDQSNSDFHKCLTCDEQIKFKYTHCFDCTYRISNCKFCLARISKDYSLCKKCFQKLRLFINTDSDTER